MWQVGKQSGVVGQKAILSLVIGLSALVLVGCNDGSGDSSNSGDTSVPAAPVLSLTPTTIKTFSFSWADVTGETEYRLLENNDGVSGYTQIASIEADAGSFDVNVFLPENINARYILQACNDGGCSDSAAVYVAGTLAEAVGYVKASNTGASDIFGHAVALSGDGNTLAVGTPNEDSFATGVDGVQDDDSATNSGAVYVFSRNGMNWSQQAYIKASNSEAGDLFGFSVALSEDGNTLAVGAYREDSSASGINGDQMDNDATDSGAVYLFSRNDSTWSQQAYVKASNSDAGDRFGYSLALANDGNTLAVGAYTEGSNATSINGNQEDDTAENSGAAYVFVRSGITWSQHSYLKASNSEASDFFGIRVALSGDGDTLAVGAHRESSDAKGVDGDQSNNLTYQSGAAYVFSRTSGIWSQQAYIKASNGERQDMFGWTLALSNDGSTLAVGAHLEDSNATGINGEQGDNSAEDSGAVYVFIRGESVWSQQAYIKASNTQEEAWFGSSLAMSADGNTLAIGAYTERRRVVGINGMVEGSAGALDSGAVYLFKRSNDTWSQHAYIKAPNVDPSDAQGTSRDRFGVSMGLASDGSTLAVGAYQERSNATGVGGDQSNNEVLNAGAVYLY